MPKDSGFGSEKSFRLLIVDKHPHDNSGSTFQKSYIRHIITAFYQVWWALVAPTCVNQLTRKV